MLQLLSSREQGLDPPWLLPALYGSQRFVELGLSSEKEFDRAHQKGVASLDIDRDGRYLISGGSDVTGTIAIHDTAKPLKDRGRYKCPVVASTAAMRGRIQPGWSYAISVVQWYPHDTGIFTTSSVDRTLRVWDTNELCVVEKFAFSAPVYTHCMAVADAHSLIAVSGKECKITLCDLQSGSATHILQDHRKPVMALAWSPRDPHLLASGSHDNRVLLWDVRKASGPLLTLDQHNGSGSANVASVVTAHNGHVNGLRFSSDGLFLVSFGTDNQLRLWDAFSGQNTLVNYGRIPNVLPQTCQFTITPHSCTLHPVLCVPSGGAVLLLEMFTGRKVGRLQGHYGQVNCLATHPFEQELYSGGSDTNILAWAPPLPVTPPSSSRTSYPAPPPRKAQGPSTSSAPPTRATNVYQDTWSSDEED